MLKAAGVKIKSFFRQHWLAIIFALLAGFLAAGSFWLSIYSAGSQYRGIIFSHSSDDYIYLARIQEILDGHGWAGSPYFYEYKAAKPLMLPYGEYFYALPASIFRFSAVTALTAGIFLFPAILFFLVYLLIHDLTRDRGSFTNKINAITGALLVMVANYLLMYDFMREFLAGRVGPTYNLLWARTVNPITGGIMLFVFLLLLWAMAEKRRWWLFLPAGVVLGLMSSYFFSWGLGLAVAGSLSLIFLLKKNYLPVKYFVLAAVIGFLAYLPAIINALSGGIKADSALYTRMGMSLTHAPIINKIIFTGFFVFVIFLIVEFYHKKKSGQKLDNWWWFCLALLAGGALAYNQQVVTGRLLSPRHWPQYTTPLAIVAGFTLLYNKIKPRLYWLWLIVIVITALASVGFAVSLDIKDWRGNVDDFSAIQKEAEVFSWFNNNAPKDCVVLSVEESRVRDMSLLIPAFTHCNVYNFLAWTVAGAPQEREEYSYLAYLRAKGIDGKTVNEYLAAHQEELQAIYSVSEEEVTGDYTDARLMADATAEVAAKYKDFLKTDFTSGLKKYRLDYILVDDKFNAGIGRLIPGLRYITRLNGRYLYQF